MKPFLPRKEPLLPVTNPIVQTRRDSESSTFLHLVKIYGLCLAIFVAIVLFTMYFRPFGRSIEPATALPNSTTVNLQPTPVNLPPTTANLKPLGMVVPKSSVLTAFDQQTHEPTDLNAGPNADVPTPTTEGITKPLEQSVSSDVPVASDLDSNPNKAAKIKGLEAILTTERAKNAAQDLVIQGLNTDLEAQKGLIASQAAKIKDLEASLTTERAKTAAQDLVIQGLNTDLEAQKGLSAGKDNTNKALEARIAGQDNTNKALEARIAAQDSLQARLEEQGNSVDLQAEMMRMAELERSLKKQGNSADLQDEIIDLQAKMITAKDKFIETLQRRFEEQNEKRRANFKAQQALLDSKDALNAT
eukprot:184778_1